MATVVVENGPELKQQGAVPATVPAPNLARVPAVLTQPPRILLFHITENGKVSVGPGTGNNGAVEANAGSAFEIQSTIGGFTFPQVTTAQRNAIPVDALTRTMVFNVTTQTYDAYNGATWEQASLTIVASIANVPLTIVERDAAKLISVSGVNNAADAASDLTIQSGRDISSIAARHFSVLANTHIGLSSTTEAIELVGATYISLGVGGTLMRIEPNKLGFYGAVAVTRPTAYTLTFATAGSKTLPAAVSEVFVGIDNTAVGAVFATNANLNTVAAQVNANAQVLKQLIEDIRGLGLLAT